METCMVTGASGFLGREVVRRLARDRAVLGITHRQPLPGFRTLDLRDGRRLAEWLRESAPDAVVHLAAYRDPDFCEGHREETWALNVHPLQVLCDTLPARVPLLFVSTDYVFDGRRPPYREEDAVCPINLYGQSKVAAEQMVSQRPGSILLRIPLLIGGADRLENSGFITQMWNTVHDKTPRLEDDVIVRFPTWTRDVAEGIAFLLQNRHSGPFHLSSLRGATRYGWMREFAELFGESADHLSPSAQVVPRRAERPLNSQLSCERLQSMGFNHFTDFRQVAETVLQELGVLKR